MFGIGFRLAFTAVACLLASPVWAQTSLKPPPAPSAGATPANPAPSPDRTTASFGDWVLRCDRRTDVTPPQRFCELGQAIQRAGEAGPQAQVAFGRLAAGEPIRLTTLFPINVSIQPAPKLIGEGKDAQTLEITWLRCLPTGCFANVAVSENDLKKLRARTEPARLEYRDGTGRDVVLGVSFRGFSEAFQAFDKESAN